MKRLIKTEVDREMAIAFLKRIDLQDRPFLFSCTQEKIKRSIQQNRLERLWLTCISHETGNDTDDLHKYFKEKYTEPIITRVFGKEIITYTTTNMNTIQFTNFLEKIRIEADRDLGIRLPLPEDKYWQEFYDFYVDKL